MSFLVLNVRSYSFDAEDGRHISGASVTYLDLTPTPSSDAQGVPPLTVSVPPEVATQFPSAPAIYQLEFTQRPGKGGRPMLALARAELVRPVNLGDL